MESIAYAKIFTILLVAAIIAFTVYHLIKMYFNTQYNLRAFETQHKYADQSVPLKLQAYERLIIMIERISVPNLISRLATKNMRAEELINTLMIGVNQEYEFNLTQQLYISDNLWKIIKLSKDEVLAGIHEATQDVDPNSSGAEASHKLLQYFSNSSADILAKARLAIKDEANIILPK